MASIAALVVAGVIVKIKDKDGNTVAEIKAPTGVSVEVQPTPAVASAPILKPPVAHTPGSHTVSQPPLAVFPFDAAQARAHLEAWAAHLGVPVEFVDVSGDARISMLVSGQIDIAVANTSATLERAKSVDFSIPYNRAGLRIIVQKDAGITKMEDLAGKKIVVGRGSTGETFIQKAAPQAELVYTDTFAPEGVLLVDKPAGMTSHDVVDRIRKVARTRRVGHTGTLDPMATGLLVMCLGGATRVVPYLTGVHKEYAGRIRLGAFSSTYDADGEIVAQPQEPPAEERPLREAMARQLGWKMQLPPPFSAVNASTAAMVESEIMGRGRGTV